MSRPSYAPRRSHHPSSSISLSNSANPNATQSLTEELEKLEQQITLTLQEIDSNFAKAHRIVTGSVLPAVERYARGSEGVWENAKFWKGFFETAAGVKLDHYAEEMNGEEDETLLAGENEEEESGVEGSEVETSEYESGVDGSEMDGRSGVEGSEMARSELDSDVEGSDQLEGSLVGSSIAGENEEDVTMTPGRAVPHKRQKSEDDVGLGSSPDMHSTPRAVRTTGTIAEQRGKSKPTNSRSERIAAVPSPYEAMRRELYGISSKSQNGGKAAPITPGKRGPALPDMSMTTPGSSSPFGAPPESAFRSATKSKYGYNNNDNKDTIMHHDLLGKTYRVGFTPLAGEKTFRGQNNENSTIGGVAGAAGKKKATGTPVSKWAHMMDETLSSSPDEPTPQLRAELFTPGKGHGAFKPRAGVSIQTPGRKNAIEKQRERRKSGNASRKSGEGLTGTSIAPRTSADSKSNILEDDFEAAVSRGRAGFTGRMAFNIDSDEEEGLPEMSPLKTMQMDFFKKELEQGNAGDEKNGRVFGGGRLVQTPAREASRRIVQDLLFSAGDVPGEEQEVEEYSPSIVVKSQNYQDDTF